MSISVSDENGIGRGQGSQSPGATSVLAPSEVQPILHNWNVGPSAGTVHTFTEKAGRRRELVQQQFIR